MERMCAQTRPRFILSSERLLEGMESEPMLTPREKSPLPENYRLVGLVVKAPSSRAEGPGFESRLRRDFFGVEIYQ